MSQKPLSTGEVAERFGVSPAAVVEWADKGLLSSYRTPGGHRRFRLADVEALLVSTGAVASSEEAAS